MELEECREQIDVIDKKMTQLLEQRMAIVARVAEYKEMHHMDVYDPKREIAVLDKIAILTKNEKLIPHIKQIYTCIMDESKKYERKRMER
ncbi:chorismate mutase [Megasphaera paucivorans]|uniref:Chorismate mutase n=1 Tax=Megasphaera paucivorans TaxID=349095 RepID=A0A1G9Q1W0_9FIRM|nr:chorismate mutase [Megasphaera paucivorans]SDM05000.1 chorismate mutase [Megasphaera paucivorans]